MPMPRYIASKDPIVIGDKLIPAVVPIDREGKVTGDPVPSSAYRQSVKGEKVHGGHCAHCHMELEPMSRESLRGQCDDCYAKLVEAVS